MQSYGKRAMSVRHSVTNQNQDNPRDYFLVRVLVVRAGGGAATTSTSPSASTSGWDTPRPRPLRPLRPRPRPPRATTTGNSFGIAAAKSPGYMAASISRSASFACASKGSSSRGLSMGSSGWPAVVVDVVVTDGEAVTRLDENQWKNYMYLPGSESASLIASKASATDPTYVSLEAAVSADPQAEGSPAKTLAL